MTGQLEGKTYLDMETMIEIMILEEGILERIEVTRIESLKETINEIKGVVTRTEERVREETTKEITETTHDDLIPGIIIAGMILETPLITLDNESSLLQDMTNLDTRTPTKMTDIRNTSKDRRIDIRGTLIETHDSSLETLI